MASVPVLLITANVGSVFEDPTSLLNQWVEEFLRHIAEAQPKFIGIHLQEVGGKTYEKSLEHVAHFIKMLCESSVLEDFERIRIYLDEDFSSAEHFTALGNVYFVHKSIRNVKLWNFLTHTWESADGKSINTGNIESIATKEKAKFPQHFFPECKWSRKGFLRTRWSVEGSTFDLVNIHLFHDASNFAAQEETPSVYCKSRRKALVYTLERFHRDAENNIAPYFVFGDFNFRCDTEGVVKNLTKDLTMHRLQSVKSDHTKVQYRDTSGQNVLTVGKKEFTHAEHQSKFKEEWLRQFDKELIPLKELLFEYDINFPPSYPYEEDPSQPDAYMFTRCPAWCDRILLSPAARALLDENDAEVCKIYGIIGEKVCMGDHKPVYLKVNIKANQGTVKCSCDITIKKYNNHHHINNNNLYNDADHHNNNQIIHNILDIRKDPCIKCYESISLALEKLHALDPAPPHYLFENGVSDTAGQRTLKLKQRFDAMKLHHHNRMLANKPLISINVTDTDNNLEVCMCALQFGYSDDDLLSSVRKRFRENAAVPPCTEANICPICLNIIKLQSNEHRKTLVAKKLMLANDIIVNRIDTHYLNTYTNGGGGGGMFRQPCQDPYTPESVESHSPLPEIEEAGDGDTDGGQRPDDSLMSEEKMSNLGGVSPRQLKSRLELLQSKTSFHAITSDTSDDEIDKGKKGRKCCCAIL